VNARQPGKGFLQRQNTSLAFPVSLSVPPRTIATIGMQAAMIPSLVVTLAQKWSTEELANCPLNTKDRNTARLAPMKDHE
jgi:hypothetical protein